MADPVIPSSVVAASAGKALTPITQLAADLAMLLFAPAAKEIGAAIGDEVANFRLGRILTLSGKSKAILSSTRDRVSPTRITEGRNVSWGKKSSKCPMN